MTSMHCALLLQEVHDSLVSIEAEAERMYANERTLMDADTQDRDRLYARAQSVRMQAIHPFLTVHAPIQRAQSVCSVCGMEALWCV